MLYRAAADAVLLLHLAFVLFVVLGGFLVLRWRKLAWAHLPAVAWGALIEFSGWICPLTPLEIALRHAAGDAAYAGDFVEHYIVALLYPDSLTRDVQVALGIAVVLLNTVIYGAVLRRQYRRQRG
jgi:hypothetical protein